VVARGGGVAGRQCFRRGMASAGQSENRQHDGYESDHCADIPFDDASDLCFEFATAIGNLTADIADFQPHIGDLLLQLVAAIRPRLGVCNRI